MIGHTGRAIDDHGIAMGIHEAELVGAADEITEESLILRTHQSVRIIGQHWLDDIVDEVPRIRLLWVVVVAR